MKKARQKIAKRLVAKATLAAEGPQEAGRSGEATPVAKDPEKAGRPGGEGGLEEARRMREAVLVIRRLKE